MCVCFCVFFVLFFFLSFFTSLRLCPGKASDYAYLSYGKAKAPMDDKQEFKSVLEAIGTLGIDGDDASGMLGIVAAILHLGNVEFVDDGSDGSKVADTEASLAGRSFTLKFYSSQHAGFRGFHNTNV